MFNNRPEAFVLFYHRIHDGQDPFFPGLAPELFEWQMRFIAERFTVVPLESLPERMAEGPSRPLLALTFDDGYRDVYDHVYPALRRLGLPATVFVVASCLDSGAYIWPDKVSYLFKRTSVKRLALAAPLNLTFSLDTAAARIDAASRLRAVLKRAPDATVQLVIDRLQDALEVPDFDGLRGSMLSLQHVKEMQEHRITIGSHTLSHPVLTRIPLSAARTEIAESKVMLERLLGAPVTTFCYPNGLAEDISDPIKQLVRDSGYRVACTAIFGANASAADPFALRRIPFTRRLLGAWPVRLLGELRHRVSNVGARPVPGWHES